MRARVDAQSTSLFIAQVRIGTFSTPPPYQTYYLHIDTGSELIWMQCEDCKFKPHQCYPQIDPPFPRSRSRSYVPLLCNKHGLCYPKQCAGMFCSFYIQYADGSTTFGLLAYENFFFDSGRNGSYQSVRLVFGCGLDNRGSTYDKEK
ncbi:hypothetical protein L1049_028557 [Liquidambar formosana]|uniref:Peptidase A1 domain-containing protein n=1 Tax=Liquidambar formosana TaxID=63359 RepID=A0AAP0RLD4_LIQFO